MSDKMDYFIDTRDGQPIGKYSATSPRDAVRVALADVGYTVHPDPDGDGLMARHGQPGHIFGDYLVDGEIVEVRHVEDVDLG